MRFNINFLIIVVLLTSIISSGKTINVKNNGTADYNNIQAAIDDANHGDIILIAPGTYTGTGNRDISFKGKAITVCSTDPNDPNIVASTIINCQGSEDEPHRGFYFDSDEEPNSILTGMTITNGYGIIEEISLKRSAGGGLFILSSPTIRKCNILQNYSQYYGAGIYIEDGNPIVEYCNIIDNKSIGDTGSAGGGLYIRDSNCMIRYCTISNNSTGWNGGGIFSYDSSPTIINCTISNNQAFNDGAGIAFSSGNPLVINCVIKNNIMTFRRGGGISCRNSNLTIEKCIISDNIAGISAGRNSGTGGGLWLSYSNIKISQCIIINNYANSQGGGIYFEISNLMITNCIISNNKAPIGSEITVYSWSGVLTDGPKPYNPEPYPVAFLSMSYNDIQGGQNAIYVYNQPGWFLLNWGQGNIDMDPLFADPNNGNYHLKSQAGRFDPNTQKWIQDDVTSPCIDAGDPNSPIGYEPFPNGGRINMGAYGGTDEASKSYFGKPVCDTIIAGDINGDCKVDYIDVYILLSHWLEEH